MKELSIHISDADMNGFSYGMTSNSMLLYNRKSQPGETLSSVICRECKAPDTSIRVVWNNRKSVLVPSSVFRLEDMAGYMDYISSAPYRPQCVQCGEFVTVWDTDRRIDQISQAADGIGVPVFHTHERVEQIAGTEDGTINVALAGNLLYISEKENGRLKNSYVAEVFAPEDALYYFTLANDRSKRITTSLPKEWNDLLGRYIGSDRR